MVKSATAILTISKALSIGFSNFSSSGNTATDQAFINSLKTTYRINSMRAGLDASFYNMLQTAGIDFYAIIGSSSILSLTPAQWQAQVETLVQNYPNIHHWQFINEPETVSSGSITPQQYFDYLVPTYNAIKGIRPLDIVRGPNVTVWTFQTVGAGTVEFDPGKVQWCQTLVSLGGLNYIDEADIHLYTLGVLPSFVFNTGQTAASVISAGLDQYAGIFSSKKICISETGFRSSNCANCTPANQQAYFEQILPIISSKPYIDTLYIYMTNDEISSGAIDFGYGAFNNNGTPKPCVATIESYMNTGTV